MFPPAAAAAAFRHRSEPPSFYRSRAARCIRLLQVQHLIERCLTFHLDREDCARVLAKRANIQPVVTNAVWDGLQRENPGFFDFYYEDLGRRRLMRRNRIAMLRHSVIRRKMIPVRNHLLFF
ncbi:uncharacterized protein LOC122011616 isoform X1 [Zingiber officinale]|uniref:uncharacterized protein LOC122011616 isoform X1 n=1 Tax=Zingiber officinale TaxID=94328 RepID=UPI001C4C63A7|nr:uncharacterized protein LOC122011616 isoform X1 [Zingiber officinale]